jgi:hypothetical protein
MPGSAAPTMAQMAYGHGLRPGLPDLNRVLAENMGRENGVNWRVLLSTLAFLLAGAALGYAALSAGPLPLLTAIAFLVILLTRFRSRPEQPGGYMLGAGVAGAAILLKVISECSPPSCYYDNRTMAAVAVFVLVAVVGVGVLVRAVLQRRFSG